MKRFEILAILVFAMLVFVSPAHAQAEEPVAEEAVEEAPEVVEGEVLESEVVEVEALAEEEPVEDTEFTLPEEVLVAIFGTGGLLYITTQLLKGIIVIVQKYVPGFEVSEGFMGLANVVIGALLYGGISLAQLRGLEAAGLVDLLSQMGELLLGLVYMVAGSTAYYAFFKNYSVPYFGHSLTEGKA